jgi:hypothetical protein
MPHRSFYGWKLLAALWVIVCINLAFPIYGTSILDAVMVEDLNLNRQTLGGIFPSIQSCRDFQARLPLYVSGDSEFGGPCSQEAC